MKRPSVRALLFGCLLPSLVLAATPSTPPPVTQGVMTYYWDGTKSVAVTAGNPLPVTGGGGGGSVTQGSSPWVDDITQWANVALGAPSNYGTSPGAVAVPGVNAFVTNPVAANPGTAANWGVGASGSAPPANAIYNGANGSGATGGQLQGLVVCDKYVFKHITSATDTLAVQGVASQTVRICGFHARAAGVATWFLENTASVNANCSSSNTQISVLSTEAANTGIVDHSPFWSGLSNTSGNGLCINSTGTGGVDVGIYYAQF